MAEKLELVSVFDVLLEKGYISEKCGVQKKTTYTVHLPDEHGVGQKIGHITPKQFDDLLRAGVIESTRESKKDKYGNIYNFHKLRSAESKMIKLKEAEGAIKYLLERRLAELDKQRLIFGVTNPYFEKEEKEIWAEGYVTGYTDLLEDLKNLIECGWLDEETEEN